MQLLQIFVPACAVALALAQSSPPQKTPPSRKAQIREVRATGCVRIARDGCVLLKTLDGNTTYAFQAAPKPEEGTVVTIQGTAHQGRSDCKQGLVIDVTDWEATGDSCVE